MATPDGRTGRRRFLGGIGASGLAAAIAVFGKSTAANAANYGCCGLLFAPPNMTMAACKTQRSETEHYWLWSCNISPKRDCQCCEHYRFDIATGSAGSCYYV